MSIFKKGRALIFICLIALIFRLAISPLATHGDLTTMSEWGNWMYTHGPKGLYDWNQWTSGWWPNHPPLISLVYMWAWQFHSFLMKCFSGFGNFIALHRLAPTKFIWFFNFTKWFGEARLDNISFFLKGVILCIKLPMILADIVLAIITYLFCKQQSVNWKKYVLAFLFLPFSWYLSAVWGQSDQLSFVFLILSVILLLNNKSRKSWLSPLLFAISVNLKPTGLILTPLYLWIWFRQKKSFTSLLTGGIVSILATLYIISFFTSGSPIFYLEHLYNRIFLVLKPIITVNSLSFWRLFILGKADAITNEIVLQRITVLGYIIYFFVSTISFLVVKYKNKESILAALFISSFGGWLFLTNMHERYLFMGIMFLFFFSIYRPKYFHYFIILSIIYFIGMYLVFQAIPLPFINKIPIFSWLLSATNLFLYLKITKEMFKEFR